MKCVFVDGNIISAVFLCNLVFLEEMFECKQCIYSGRNPYRSRLGRKKCTRVSLERSIIINPQYHLAPFLKSHIRSANIQ
jgi:hypothetical protein